MQVAGIRVQPYRVSDLIAGIASGMIVLPEFQRDFDWSDEQVASLIATLIKRWPAGSLLLMDGHHTDIFFRVREFEGAPPRRADLDIIVLDGQQRLTGLFQAVYDTGDFVYAISTAVLTPDITVDDLEDGIKSFSRTLWDRDYRDVPWESTSGWIPFYALRSPTEFFAWRDGVLRAARLPNARRDELAIVLADAYRHGLEAFHQYDFPAVILERGVPAAAIARIFERVNTTGMPLSTFDLMVAKTFTEQWNLRDRWDAALAESAHFASFFGDDGIAALQVVALTHSGGVRQSDVLSLDPDVVRRNWDEAVVALDHALSVVVEHCGVANPGWLPYQGLLLTLAGVAREHRDLSLHLDLIRAWFFSRTFGLSYEVAANTVTIREVDTLNQAIHAGMTRLPMAMSREVVSTATRRRQGAIWRGVLCALAASGATHTGLLGESTELRPVNVLRREPNQPRGHEPAHLLALGFVLAGRKAARELTGNGADYLREHLLRAGEVERVSAMDRQLLPRLDTWGNGDSEFIAARLERLSGFLKTVTGAGLVEALPLEGT